MDGFFTSKKCKAKFSNRLKPEPISCKTNIKTMKLIENDVMQTCPRYNNVLTEIIPKVIHHVITHEEVKEANLQRQTTTTIQPNNRQLQKPSLITFKPGSVPLSVPHIYDIVKGNKKSIQEVDTWLTSRLNHIVGPSLMLYIIGPPGIGRTFLIKELAKHKNQTPIQLMDPDLALFHTTATTTTKPKTPQSKKRKLCKDTSSTWLHTIANAMLDVQHGRILLMDGIGDESKVQLEDLNMLNDHVSNQKTNPLICILDEATTSFAALNILQQYTLVRFFPLSEFDIKLICQKVSSSPPDSKGNMSKFGGDSSSGNGYLDHHVTTLQCYERLTHKTKNNQEQERTLRELECIFDKQEFPNIIYNNYLFPHGISKLMKQPKQTDSNKSYEIFETILTSSVQPPTWIKDIHGANDVMEWLSISDTMIHMIPKEMFMWLSTISTTSLYKTDQVINIYSHDKYILNNNVGFYMKDGSLFQQYDALPHHEGVFEKLSRSEAWRLGRKQLLMDVILPQPRQSDVMGIYWKQQQPISSIIREGK